MKKYTLVEFLTVQLLPLPLRIRGKLEFKNLG